MESHYTQQYAIHRLPFAVARAAFVQAPHASIELTSQNECRDRLATGTESVLPATQAMMPSLLNRLILCYCSDSGIWDAERHLRDEPKLETLVKRRGHLVTLAWDLSLQADNVGPPWRAAAQEDREENACQAW